MPALKENKKYTIEDIMALPENEHAELIDGQIYYQAAPSRKHQDISGELYAPFAVLLNDDDSVYIEPDISVICDRNKLSDRGCEGAPDWIIEIVSPGSRRMDYMIKLFKYRTAGVREYWIVDYAKDMVMVYNFEQNEMETYTMADKVPVGIYDNLVIDFAEMDI